MHHRYLPQHRSTARLSHLSGDGLGFLAMGMEIDHDVGSSACQPNGHSFAGVGEQTFQQLNPTGAVVLNRGDGTREGTGVTGAKMRKLGLRILRQRSV